MASISPIAHDPARHTNNWLILLSRILLPLGLFAIALFGAGVNAAHAGNGKVASDLRAALTHSGANAKWAANTALGKYVQVVISADTRDPALTDLRRAVLAAGGSVFYAYQSAPALLAVLPAAAVDTIAARDDVAFVVPNRVAFRTASFLQEITGVAGVRASNPTSFNGAGIGIAFLDSGIDSCHAAFGGSVNGGGKCKSGARFGASVDFTRLSSAQAAKAMDWTRSVDLSAGYAPGSAVYRAFERAIDGSGTANPDVYGHGTHVASVAAGESIAGAPDAAGIVPGATLYDIRVLDDNGIGQISDVLAGIDWVIANSKARNIRVMNLSLAAPTNGSFLTDPLCRAARAATAMGIVVVVAVGNYGVDVSGAELLGVIGRPGQRAQRHHRRLGASPRHALRAPTRRSTASARVGPRAAAGSTPRAAPPRQSPEARPRRSRQQDRWRNGGQRQSGQRAGRREPVRSRQAAPRSNGRLMLLSGTSIAAPAVVRCSGGDAAGKSRSHPRARQGDPAVHGAAVARSVAHPAGHGTSQCRRRCSSRAIAAHRHRGGSLSRYAQAGRQTACAPANRCLRAHPWIGGRHRHGAA